MCQERQVVSTNPAEASILLATTNIWREGRMAVNRGLCVIDNNYYAQMEAIEI